MNARTSTTRSLLAGALLIASIGLAACAPSTGNGVDDPVVTPAPSQPTTPGPVVTPEPSDPAGTPVRVDLEVIGGDTVTVDIRDESGKLVRARSGQVADGASIGQHELRIENLDDRTLQLTWSDWPIDNQLDLYIVDGGARFVLVQPEPEYDGDTVTFDRQLILEFSSPIDADSIEGFLQDGLDTPGQG